MCMTYIAQVCSEIDDVTVCRSAVLVRVHLCVFALLLAKLDVYQNRLYVIGSAIIFYCVYFLSNVTHQVTFVFILEPQQL